MLNKFKLNEHDSLAIYILEFFNIFYIKYFNHLIFYFIKTYIFIYLQLLFIAIFSSYKLSIIILIMLSQSYSLILIYVGLFKYYLVNSCSYDVNIFDFFA